MNRSQRIVLILYCLLLVYCCVWIPWHVVTEDQSNIRVGYGWLWSGPAEGGPLASPELSLIALRIVAATSIFGALFLFAGLWKLATWS
jgi:hypothetical protein